jgi:hypothetical protein
MAIARYRPVGGLSSNAGKNRRSFCSSAAYVSFASIFAGDQLAEVVLQWVGILDGDTFMDAGHS